MSLLDTQSQETVSQAVSVTTKVAVPAALGGQLIFGYTINEFAALVGMTIAIIQFVYWVGEKVYELIKRRKAHGCKV